MKTKHGESAEVHSLVACFNILLIDLHYKNILQSLWESVCQLSQRTKKNNNNDQ